MLKKLMFCFYIKNRQNAQKRSGAPCCQTTPVAPNALGVLRAGCLLSVWVCAASLSAVPAMAAIGDRSNELQVPSLQGNTVGFSDQYHNRALGYWSLQRLNNSSMLLHDPWVQEVVNEMTWALNAQVRQQAPLAVVIVNDPNINAFAIPGGVIGINTGTITAAKSLDEAGSVLAHEVAHLSQRHYEHSKEASTQAMLMQIGGMLAAIAASTADGDAATAIMLGSQTAAMNSQMAFSRDNERDADRVGMQILAQAGYDPRAMPSFFATMNQKSQLNQSANSFLPSFIRTHPLSNERLSDAQARAQDYPNVPLVAQRNQQVLFDLLSWRVKVLTKQSTFSALSGAASQSVGAKLALAQWYGEQHRFDEADRLVAMLENLAPQTRQQIEPLLSITKAELAGRQDDWQSAVEILTRQQRLYPERRDLRVYLASALIQKGEGQQAQSLLRPLVQKQKTDRQVWQLLYQANEVMARNAETPALVKVATINALRYRSQDELWRGRYERALVTLTQAQSEVKRLQQGGAGQGANQIGTAPLLASIEQEMEAVRSARDFEP